MVNLLRALLLLLVFAFSFMWATVVTDYICQVNGYYDQYRTEEYK